MTGTILDLQQKQSGRFESPILSFGKLAKLIKEMMSSDTKIPEEKHQKIKKIFYFMQNISRINLLKHLPPLVKFYLYLNKEFSQIVTDDEANDLIFPNCLSSGRFNVGNALQRVWNLSSLHGKISY